MSVILTAESKCGSYCYYVNAAKYPVHVNSWVMWDQHSEIGKYNNEGFFNINDKCDCKNYEID